ncbi:hypothetical protein FVEG_17536 [Fusarium verticillioides 7600]|uniref:Uncharacterized protein n=1 Tax=Gibberella moniliformis (strain M3125 / FGSC 7600) TaxID=334819 RepID=W7MW21_GIBM7|nr:hypothetical protein FVEG_17536 [Fusarium verticillioides 7600]EWG55518.1 hypothetical protein FVEG_17536 [Fusarium verticillioides 7600]
MTTEFTGWLLIELSADDDDEESEQTPRAEPSLSDERASQRTGSTGASGASSPTKALRALKYQDAGLDHVKLDVSDETLSASLVELANDMQDFGNGESVVPVYLMVGPIGSAGIAW